MKAWMLLTITCILPATAVCSTFLSYTGNLSSPEDAFEVTFLLSSTANVAIQTWGFGGGTNAAGALISGGGFDPMVTLFSGPQSTASIYSVAGSPAADADTLFNPPFSFVGNCPPAGMVTIGTGAGSLVCGDDIMQISGLTAGFYTLVLTDANYIPAAVNPGTPLGLLSDGFSDLTGGVFQTCNTTSDGTTTCITPTSHFAVDIVDLSGSGVSTPEPSSFPLLAIGLVALGTLWNYRRRNRNEPGKAFSSLEQKHSRSLL